MSIAKEVKEKISSLKEGKIITYQDFSYLQSFNAVSLVLSRLVKEGLIERLEKGKYFKPKQSKFGVIGPTESQILSTILDNAYISGSSLYNGLGLSTQVANEVIIVGGKYNRKTQVGKLKIRYRKKDGNFNKRNIKYFQILDAIKDVKRIPGTSINEAIRMLTTMVDEMENEDQKKLVNYALDYRPMVRALLGAILENNGNVLFNDLKKTLNPLTSYNVRITDDSIIPNRENWRIK